MTQEMPEFKSEAPGQAAGYYFQLRYALLRALQLLRKDPTASISLERIDDISIENGNSIQEVNQLKHTVLSLQKLTEGSPQIWRTLANWAEFMKLDLAQFAKVKLNLVTNAQLSGNDSLSNISCSVAKRDSKATLDGLVEAAKKSTNQKTLKDRQSFLNLDYELQHSLIDAITIVENAPNLAGAGVEIEEELHYSCEMNQLGDFREMLEGWWFQRTVTEFSAGKAPKIPLLEVEQKVSFLREHFKRKSLTLDAIEADIKAEELDDHTFVKQVRAIVAGNRRLLNAQRDYLKASSQRSKWVREMRIDPAELNRFDEELENRWHNKFAGALDELPSTCSNDEKCKMGRSVLAWAEVDQSSLRGVTAQFLSSGSYHILADQIRIGWHPDFEGMFKNGE